MVFYADDSILFGGRPVIFPTQPIVKIAKEGRVIKKDGEDDSEVVEVFVDRQER